MVTPIELMDEAARQHPVLTSRLMKLKPKEREEHVRLLKIQLTDCGEKGQIEQLRLVVGHVEMETYRTLR